MTSPHALIEGTLLPCPFCGGEAARFTIGAEEPDNEGGDCICCIRCNCSTSVEFGRKENLVSRWNTRAMVGQGPDVEAMREALVIAVAALGRLNVRCVDRPESPLKPLGDISREALANIMLLLGNDAYDSIASAALGASNHG